MSAVTEMQAALAAEGTPFRLVGGALELAAVTEQAPKATPAAYVLVAKDASAPNDRVTGPVLQRSERDIMVVYVLKSVAQPQASGAIDALEEIITYGRGRLIGLTPSDSREKITHVGGEVVEVRNGYVWFEDTFSSPAYIKEQS